MSGMTNYLEKLLLEATLNGQTFMGPSKVYAGLYTSNLSEDGAGTEIPQGSYSRQVVSFSAPNTTDQDVSYVENTNEIEFEPGVSEYGAITHVGISDSASGGNVLFYAELSTAIVVPAGTGIKMHAGDLRITLD